MPCADRNDAELIQRAADALGPGGLVLRGGLNLAPGDPSAPGPGGGPARAVLLVGNLGAGYWPVFSAWCARQPGPLPDPLDAWSREVIAAAALAIGASVAMPNDRPFAPFQQWAMRAEGLRPSPLGLLMHPRHGLWHAFRGALLLDLPLSPGVLQGLDPTAEGAAHPCDLCAAKPCLEACPVAAHGARGFAHDACLSHIASPVGSACARACLARNACPHGAEWRYPPEVQAFHQRAFAGPSRQPLRAAPEA